MESKEQMTKLDLNASEPEKDPSFIRKMVLKIAYPMEFVTTIPVSTVYGVWYLSPEHHLFESFVMVIIGLIIFATTFTFDGKPINAQLSVGEDTIKYLLTIDYFVHIFYKSQSKPINRGLWWLLQPCPMNQLALLLCLYFPQYLTINVLQYLLTLTCGALSALLCPDTSANSVFLSTQHFYFQHLCIYILPHFWLFKHMQTMQQTLSIYPVLTAHAIAMIYSFIILEIGSILSGVNINYALSPPKIKIISKYGKKFKIVMFIYLFIAHILSGYIIPKTLLFVANIVQNYYVI